MDLGYNYLHFSPGLCKISSRKKIEVVVNGSTKKLVRIADYDKILDISICSLKSVSIWVPRIYSLIYSLGPRQNKTEISHNWMIHPFFS
jgi:hypothetical protein